MGKHGKVQKRAAAKSAPTGLSARVRKPLALIWLVFAASHAMANPLAMDFSALKPGQYQVVHTNEGAVLVNRYVGQVGDLFAFEVYFGTEPIGVPVEHVFTDASGQFVRSEQPNGRVSYFEPNDCSRTPGECRYVARQNTGAAQSFVQSTEPTSDGFRFVRRDSAGRIAMQGQAVLHDSGWIRSMTLSAPGGRAGWFREELFVR